ncbi:MAG: hypothetical protein PHU80_02670, partial [Kiritimatiellae bacterium]|nr:hypothetical protein [Kiritimatiellia bacterium]
ELLFPVILKANDRLVCRDGKSWQVYGSDRSRLAEGSLDKKIPILNSGSTDIAFTCVAPDRAQVKLVKVYR